VGPASSLDDLVTRYLAAFGPASVIDMQAWSGMTRMREVFERLRPRLRTFRDERGKRALRPSASAATRPDTPAHLASCPTTTTSFSPRRSIAHPGPRPAPRDLLEHGVMRGSLLLDGFVRAMWIPIEGTLVITPFGDPIPQREHPPIAEEGMRLLEFLAPGERHRVTFGPPD